MNVIIDKFDNAQCRAGGEHQWFGDGVIHFTDGKSMNARKFTLLSPKMQKEYSITGQESTCNKCGAHYTHAHNPYYL